VVAGWDQATQSRVRRRLRRIGTARVRDVVTDLAAYGERLESYPQDRNQALREGL
jgi:hypothetical protein